MANTPTREHREEELRDRAEVLVDRASQGWGIAHGHYAALVRAVTQALADAEQRGFERGREAERAENNTCWHCKDALWPQKPRCEMCPDECDDEACSEDGCREQRKHLAKGGE